MVSRALLFGRLKNSLHLLAAPADIQLLDSATFGHKADALYLSFAHWRIKVMGNFYSDIAADQLAHLELLEQLFLSMGKECWTDYGVKNSVEWNYVRLLSAITLQTFGWLPVTQAHTPAPTCDPLQHG